MHTETLSIGSELTAGSTVDTNASWLSKQLAKLGLMVSRHTILPDELPPLVAFIQSLKPRAGDEGALLLITGGLGPTLDDVTREAVAQAMGRQLAENAESRAAIEEIFRRRSWPMAASNLRQAQLPQGAEALPNDRGTAPGFYITDGHLHVFSMPGVPNEMKAMFQLQLEGRLQQLVPAHGVVLERTLHTFGQGESSVGQTIAEFMAPGLNPSVGTTVSNGMVSVRLRARGGNQHQAERLLDETSSAIRAAIGDIYIGADSADLPHVVGRLLSDRQETLAVAESCTGGLIAKMLTDLPGASQYFIEGLVTYANEAKMARLEVPAEVLAAHGAVSREVAGHMAETLRRQAGTSYALSTTGIAGPTGGTAEKPVGLVYIGLADAHSVQVIKPVMPGDREHIRIRSSLAALNLLRLTMMGRRG